MKNGGCILLFILAIATHQSFAQMSCSITGIVQDSVTGQRLDGATIILGFTEAPDWSRHAVCGKSGFSFTHLAAGRYQLSTTFIGYESGTVYIQVDTTLGGRQMIHIKLNRVAKELAKVTVKANIAPIQLKGDTLVFNSSAFPTPPDATVEDLLRKLPGVDIDKDGNVFVQGQKVDRIYIDGKELFLNDPRSATRNLAADMVAQIETFDSQTERGRLTGIKDVTGSISLNIRLKRSRKKELTGKVYAGVGPSNNPNTLAGSYSGGGSVTSLGSVWVSGSGNLNNINNQFTGVDNNDGPGTAGIQRFNNADFNFRKDSLGKSAITVSLGSNGIHSMAIQTTSMQTYLSDSSLFQKGGGSTESSSQSSYARAYLAIRADSATAVDLRLNCMLMASSNNTNDTTGISVFKDSYSYVSNAGIAENHAQSNGYSIGTELSMRHFWKSPGKLLYVSFTQDLQSQKQPQAIFNDVQNYDSGGIMLPANVINQVSTQTNKANGFGITATYVEPLWAGYAVDLTYVGKSATAYADRNSLDFDSLTNKFDLPDTLTSDHFKSYDLLQQVSVDLSAKGTKFSYRGGIAFQQDAFQNQNLTDNNTIQLRPRSWYPELSLTYIPQAGHTVNLNYTFNTVNPTLRQLQPIPDLTNPYLVSVGNPALEQQVNHTINASLISLNSANFNSFRVFVQANYIQHEITPSITILANGIQEVQYVNHTGPWNLTSLISYGFAFREPQKLNGSAYMTTTYRNDVSFTNGLKDITTGISWAQGGKLNYHPLARLFVQVEAGVSYSGARYSVNSDQSTNTWQENYFVEGSYEFAGALTLSTNYRLQINAAQPNIPGTRVSVWNASAYKNIFRQGKGQIRLSVFSILNTHNNYVQTAGLNYTELQSSNFAGRILMLSFIYHFSNANVKKSLPAGN